MARLELKNISFSYEDGKKILDDVGFSIQRGEIISLVGKSGSGKTTLFDIASNRNMAYRGKVANSFTSASFVFQETRLLPWKNLIENISFSLIDSREDKKEVIKRAQRIAMDLGLDKKDFTKYPKALSGGMARRVSIARALIKKPDILFLDEPFNGLDIGVKKELFSILVKLCKKDDIAIFFITHDFSEAVSLSDKILFLDKKESGSIIQNSLEITTAQESRDSKYVYQKMVELLENKEIKGLFYS